MAPSPDDPRNPFESFRRFADEQMSSLTRIITGDPRKVQPSKPSESSGSDADVDLPWIVQAMSEEARRRYREVQREMNKHRLECETAAMERQAAHNDAQARCPYRPADQEVPRNTQRPSADPAQQEGRNPVYPHFPTSEAFGHDNEDESGFDGLLAWPLRYLFTSSYSPLYLEKQRPFEDQGPRWRHAFEDLIAVQSGMGMEDYDPSKSKLCTTHWLNSMMNRGVFGRGHVQSQEPGKFHELRIGGISFILGPVPDFTEQRVTRLLQGLAQNEKVRSLGEEADKEADEEDGDDNADKDDEDFCDDEDDVEEDEDGEEVMTELDLYGRMMPGSKRRLFGGPFLEHLASQAFRQESSIEEKAVSPTRQGKDGIPSLVSTLTTTERTTLPDGSIHTKMVLKKRFADGREESTETTHTAKDQQTTLIRKLVEKAKAEALTDHTVNKVQNPEKKSKGWFWS